MPLLPQGAVLAVTQLTDVPYPPKSDSLPASTREVLILDDSAETAKALDRVLVSAGYKPVICPTLADAMAWVERAEPGHCPVAMLVDIHLPDGNGLDFAHRARTVLGAEVPVVVLSGDTSIENLRALPEGQTLFVAKPFHMPTLLNRLAGWSATPPTA